MGKYGSAIKRVFPIAKKFINEVSLTKKGLGFLRMFPETSSLCVTVVSAKCSYYGLYSVFKSFNEVIGSFLGRAQVFVVGNSTGSSSKISTILIQFINMRPSARANEGESIATRSPLLLVQFNKFITLLYLISKR